MATLVQPEIWAPFYKQELFISLPFSVNEALYGGAAGGGKSELLVLLPLIYKFHEHPLFKGIILRRTFPELEKEIIIRSEKYYKSAAGKYNDQKRVWKFPSGAHIFFGHAENEKDIKKYDGIEYNYIAFDELTHFTEFQYLFLAMSRSRSATPELPAIVRNSTNPGNIGHAWVRKRFVEPYSSGGKIIIDKKTGLKRFYLQAMGRDNPHLMSNTPDYLLKLEMMPEAEKRAKLYGDWFTYEGQVFDNFRIEPLQDEPSNARHTIEPFPIPDYWPKVLAIDWGYKANTVAYWGAINPDGQVIVYREYCVKETDVSVWATEIGELTRQDKNIKFCLLDTNAWDQRGEEETIAQQFQKFSKLVPHQASKGRISGKILLQEYLRWRPRPKREVQEEFDRGYADALLRHRGLDAYNDYLNRFQQQPDEILPKILFFDTCNEAIRVIPLCIYDEKNPEDVAPFNGDDAYDCIRYLLKGIVRYQDESKTEYENFRREAKINTLLAEKNNVTAYAIAKSIMADRNKGFGVKAYHRGNVSKVRNFADLIEF